ncbi:hypothetical protein M0R45_015266 [Rubus argutus]|uniref:Uncharacterized protein n=1 Tax=Rubus argutus TaxID=59490 RepID=A0AAW1XNT5_RUBAR
MTSTPTSPKLLLQPSTLSHRALPPSRNCIDLPRQFRRRSFSATPPQLRRRQAQLADATSRTQPPPPPSMCSVVVIP